MVLAMLWYLLYPFRGSTKPPTLSAAHPVRRAFYRHGKFTAHHWLIVMLGSVAIAMGFSYPTLFLSGSPTAGFVAYPHHFWSTVKRYEGDLNQADMEMRQVWIHGDYMKALEKDTLLAALNIQEDLMGHNQQFPSHPGFDGRLRNGVLSWGFHSPLMYWNNSAQAIQDDGNVLRTIEEQSHSPSSLNVALRPASVFAGKKFHGWQLEAADALVITLMNKINDSTGDRWQQRMRELATGACRDCKLFPADGHITRNRVYEFSFIPLSLQENLALTVAYSCMAIYVLLSLRRLKAFHSRFGLVVTAITQVTCSILASITVCGVLKINLANVPQNAYPFVVLVVGLENMFRLINAIVAYPATMATDLRIANALGDVGPVSVATALQNVFILFFLSRFVSSGVVAFCAFACIATLFDVFFLLTFFVAVLNVDIRRLELQDALTRTNQARAKHKPSPVKPSWFDALIQGRLPVSTRMAGTVVTTTFILSLNYHFFERHESASSIRDLFGMARGSSPSLMDLDTFTPPPMNATLTPGEWMRMQDLETAREVMRLARPGADCFIIRVFAPLIVVLAGANRAEAPIGQNEWLHALQIAAVHHFYPLVIAIVFIVTFVAVLMSILLHGEISDGELTEEEEPEVLSVHTLQLPHRLDIIKIFGHEAGHFVTLGLDRTISVTLFNRILNSYRTLSVPHDALIASSWPIRIATVDESGVNLAFQTVNGRIHVYDCLQGAYLSTADPFHDQPPIFFQFVRLNIQMESSICLATCDSYGSFRLTAINKDYIHNAVVSNCLLLGIAIVDLPGTGKRLIVVGEDGTISAYTWLNETWREASREVLPLPLVHGRLTGTVEITLLANANSDVIVLSTSSGFLFLDGPSLGTIGRFERQDDEDVPVQLLYGPPVNCPSCGSLAYTSMGYVNRSVRTQECEIATVSAEQGASEPLCLRNASPSCRNFKAGIWTRHVLQDAGAWQATSSASILGLHKVTVLASDKTSGVRGRHAQNHAALRRRTRSTASSNERKEDWRAYRFALDGHLESREVQATARSEGEDAEALYISTAGPAVSLQRHTVAVCYGNAVQIIKDVRGDAAARRESISPLSRSSSTSKRRLTPKKAL